MVLVFVAAPRAAADGPLDPAAIVCSGDFDFPCEWALSTIWCESRNEVDAYNPAGPYVGWWQVLRGPSDPYLNTVEANIQWSEWQRGLRGNPWPVCGA